MSFRLYLLSVTSHYSLYLSLILFFFFLMIRRPPRSTLFPTRRSSDLHLRGHRGDMSIHLRVVGRLAVVVIEEQSHGGGQQHRSCAKKQPFCSRIGQALRSFF